LRTLAITQNITLDGSIEMLGDWFDPSDQSDNSDLLRELHRQDREADAFLTGRRTFEDLRGYWPLQTDDPIAEIGALKEQQGRDIVITGSISLCHTLIEAGLIDEYRLFVYPMVQGRGRRLFPDGYGVPRLKLLDTKAFRSGITFSRYVPA
jgi:dihydrofolate reductase